MVINTAGRWPTPPSSLISRSRQSITRPSSPSRAGRSRWPRQRWSQVSRTDKRIWTSTPWSIRVGRSGDNWNRCRNRPRSYSWAPRWPGSGWLAGDGV